MWKKKKKKKTNNDEIEIKTLALVEKYERGSMGKMCSICFLMDYLCIKIKENKWFFENLFGYYSNGNGCTKGIRVSIS